MVSRRAEWAERVRRWRRSGLKAREFAESIGVKPATLTYWAWRLGRDGGKRGNRDRAGRGSRIAVGTQFVELITSAVEDRRFELELGNGCRLRIPAGFDDAALERLLRVVENGR
ncbi:MAG: IS66 family insertion sequence element accessory protein TnpA [Candidatus Binatia bacterium]